MQNLYNLLYREEEREMMPTLKVRFSTASSYQALSVIGVVVWSRLDSLVASRARSAVSPIQR